MQFARFARGDVARADHLRRGDEAIPRARILVVDDDEAALRALASLLRGDGFTIATATGGEAAVAEASRAPPDVVLTDLHMRPMDGVELCRRLHEVDHDLPVIVMTAHSDMQSVIESLRERAEDYLVKPLRYEAVLWCLERAIARRAAKLEQEQTQRTLNEHLVLSSIREQEHAEAEALHSAQLKALLENLSEGVLVADARSGDVTVNRAAREILGLGHVDQKPANALDLLEVRTLEDQPLDGEERPLRRALRGEQFTDYEVLWMRSNGERRRFVSTGTSVRDESGNVALAIVVFRDVTELKRLEKQRDEYLALISHDLRNPLGVVLMALATLKGAMADQQGPRVPRSIRVALAERAERNAKRMNVMLDELREATSLEAHGVALHCLACNMGELVANVVDSIDDARARRITIETDDASSWVVLADASRLERVVANLLTNALKYSSEDTHVSVRLARKGGAVELDVVDRGIGIAPESVEKLFERHYRTTAGKVRASGLGLGLYIAHLIVELHGGRIDVESELGKGSTFRLILPSHAAAA